MKGIHAHPPPYGGQKFKERCEMENLFLEGIPQEAKDEISLLYNLGIEIEELEYLIRIKFKESFNLEI